MPHEYFSHMLHRLESPSLFSVRDARHRRQPIFRKEARRLSFKIFEEQRFRDVLEEQFTVVYKPAALFNNDMEVHDEVSDMDAEEAIAFAVKRARGLVDNARPTSRSMFDICQGEGRRTREVEFIWWPQIYRFSQYGKLTIRSYIKKTSI